MLGRPELLSRLVIGLMACCLSGGAAWSDPSLIGFWITEPRDGVSGLIRVESCQDAFCGNVVHGIDANGTRVDTLAGNPVIREMRQVGQGRFEGEVIDPRSGTVYLGRLTVAGQSLALQGCILGGLLCATSQWQRP
ncbi:DUF2147 domain-containing protein [Yoonia sp. F2084L]|uniref:DUF2147 domain-containing protein n=1 Tax=Yoonia sp. F2084L TaxID=2926419 RepID=UPI001FF46B81|nr:DUF2147 domain-containing protein [Yoonia sp. F2084L]MCK0096855.1 DUF2147 domain-containing protein [Yoonia sp. F2084L]